MIRITITPAAHAAIALTATRRPGESYGNVIVPLAKGAGCGRPPSMGYGTL
jgi:hypothetical protein